MRLLISPEKRRALMESMQGRSKQGLIRMLVLIIIGVIVISVLGFDIRAAVEHPQTQANFSFLGQFIADIWNTYLAEYWEIVWRIAGPGFEVIWGAFKNFDWASFNQQQADFISSVPEVK